MKGGHPEQNVADLVGEDTAQSNCQDIVVHQWRPPVAVVEQVVHRIVRNANRLLRRRRQCDDGVAEHLDQRRCAAAVLPIDENVDRHRRRCGSVIEDEIDAVRSPGCRRLVLDRELDRVGRNRTIEHEVDAHGQFSAWGRRRDRRAEMQGGENEGE